MEHLNQTSVTYFIIKGISDAPEFQALIFCLVLLIYIISIAGNMTIVILVCLDPHLQTPMYFFLCNLSLMDISSITATLHNVFVIFIVGDNKVSFRGCITQMFLFLCFTGNELSILSVMSYDRYVAICNPLRYQTLMNQRVCMIMATVSWMFGFLQAIPHISLVCGFTCYISNEINHFFCDIVPLMQITCSDTSVLELFILTWSNILSGLTPYLLTGIPYFFIISTILKIHSSTGRQKAFYTCSSHITVVVLLYVTLFCQYLRPMSMNNLNSKKLISLFNTVAVPVLNPLIYSLKNKDVKSALGQRLTLCNV
ncbi:olfactory receptor 5V1-like [Bombina bombina]|uniref:olfactory receptor 5V1-like n=1 Tax=Bombina bombina TaxID=8345 RepID=UPI00235A884B|nr:olfactory receptor 5V1-like [Bombina bombina]